MKKILKRTGKIFCLFLLIVVLVNILSPLFCRKPDETYVESLRKTEFTSETAGVERICCIDDNEEALLWRLRMIGTAKESIVLSTFDLRADDNGTKILAALNCAAARGVKIQLLIDGIYQQLFLAGSSDFQALASYENVEVGVYNPVTPVNLFKVNYRMHDKYLIVDEKMYLLGGRNSNDIFLGDQTKGINEDRDILVYDTSEGQGESLNQLEDYFHKIWKESCVSIKNGKQSSRYTDAYRHMEEIYISLLKRYNDIETYSAWEKDTIEANKITLINNGIEAGRKTPQVLQTIQYLTDGNFSENRSLSVLQKYASEIGLDKKTGIEITESAPHVSDSYAVPSYIGQGTNAYTTSQLARYATAIATSGNVYDLTLLDRQTDSKGNTLKKYEPDIINTVDVSQNVWDDIHDGMYRVVQIHRQFDGLGVDVAGKTGTAEVNVYHPNHGMFVGYAPASDPEYAIAVRIENGYASGNACLAADDIFKYIFELTDEKSILTGVAASDTSDTSND